MGNRKVGAHSCSYPRGLGCLKTPVTWDQKIDKAKVQMPHCHYSTCVFPDWAGSSRTRDHSYLSPVLSKIFLGGVYSSSSSGLKSQVPFGLCLPLACLQEAPAV